MKTQHPGGSTNGPQSNGHTFRELVRVAFVASVMASAARAYGFILPPAIQRAVGPAADAASMTWEVSQEFQLACEKIGRVNSLAVRIICGENGLRMNDCSSLDDLAKRLSARPELTSPATGELYLLITMVSNNSLLVYLQAKDLIAQAKRLAPDNCRVITLSPYF